MEKGPITLPDGSSVEAGTFQGTNAFKAIPLSNSFAKVPVIMTTIASVDETDTISGCIINIDLAGFANSFREQESKDNVQVPETLNSIAREPGTKTIGSVQYEVAITAKAVKNTWYARKFTKTSSQPPLLLADMQTTNDTAPSELRLRQV